MRRGSQRIGESELSGSLHSQGNYHFRQRRRMESGGAVYQLSQRKLQEVVASLDAGGTTLASGGGHSSTSLPSSSWLGASKPIQEGPESGVDDGAQSTLENPAQRITTTSTFEIYYTQYMGRCTTRALRKVAVREALELSKVLQGRRILLDRTSYHVAGSSCRPSVVNALRPCAECGY